MQAYTYEIANVFVNERRYLVPTYQRDYEWTEEGQWELLFEDLLATADRLVTGRRVAELHGTDAGKAAEQTAPHFLGAVVIEPIRNAPDGMKSFAVIDGQQRLTTVALLLRALADVCSEEGSTRASRMRRLLFNPIDDPDTPPDDRYKLWPRRKDRDVWRMVMDDDPTLSPEGHLYSMARRYFGSRLRQAIAPDPHGTDDRWEPPAGADHLGAAEVHGTTVGSDLETAAMSDVAADSPIARDIDTIADAAAGLFKMVVIDLDPQDDAQVIFEVLNGRQTPLSPADLVKNLLFLRAELADEAALEAMHDRWWAPLESDWWRAVTGRGHAARGRREFLLAGWLSAQLCEEANVGHLYGEIRRYLSSGSKKVEDVLEEIAAYAVAYERIVEPPPIVDPRIADAYRRIGELAITTAQPLLLWLETRTEGELGPDAHRRAVLAVESWAVRRLVTGRQTRGYGRVLVGAIAAGKRELDAGRHGVAISNAVIESLLGTTLNWPTDDEIRTAFSEAPFYDYHSVARVRMLLAALDAAMSAADKLTEDAVVDYSALTIEHVLPQTWQTHWSEGIEPDSPEAAARERAVHRIGNLTLVTGSLNPTVSNDEWGKKKAVLVKHSRLALARGFKDIDIWDEATIASRGAALGEVALSVWPSPEELRSSDFG